VRPRHQNIAPPPPPPPPKKKALMLLTQQVSSYSLNLRAVKNKLKLFSNEASTVQQQKGADYY